MAAGVGRPRRGGEWSGQRAGRVSLGFVLVFGLAEVRRARLAVEAERGLVLRALGLVHGSEG